MPTQEPEEDTVLLLLSNKDFKDWILNPSGDRDLYWQSWLKSNPDKHAALNKARDIIQQLKFKEESLSEQETARLLENIIAGRPSANAKKVISLRRQDSFRWIKIAASILIILGSSFYTFRFLSPGVPIALKTVEVPNGQRRKISFPDGSIAYLNGGSTLTFPEKFSDTIRSVELIGEAFFEITKNPSQPFVVRTHNLRTVVLGTSFNIRAFDAESFVDVSLVTGKVQVVGMHTSADDSVYILQPGEQLVYHKPDSSFIKEAFNTEDVTGWKDGVLIFNDTDFQGVIRRLEQWYGVTVQVQCKPSGEWHVNGRFEQQSLTEVLASIQFVYDITYEIQPNNTLILKCNK